MGLGYKLILCGSLMQVPYPWRSFASISHHWSSFWFLWQQLPMQRLNSKVRLGGEHSIGPCVPLPWPSPSLGPALEQQKEQENTSGPEHKAVWDRDVPNPWSFRQHLEETLLGAVGSSVPGCTEPRWQGQLSVPWDVGFVLNKVWEWHLVQGSIVCALRCWLRTLLIFHMCFRTTLLDGFLHLGS